MPVFNADVYEDHFRELSVTFKVNFTLSKYARKSPEKYYKKEI